MIDLAKLHNDQRFLLTNAAKAFGHDEVIAVLHVEHAYSGERLSYGFYVQLPEGREKFLANSFEEALVAVSEPDFRIRPSSQPLALRADLLLQRLRPKSVQPATDRIAG